MKITKTVKYLQADNLAERFALLSKSEKRYARYLVERYGYSASMAIQTSYIHGFDAWPFDYRNDRMVRETCLPAIFGL